MVLSNSTLQTNIFPNHWENNFTDLSCHYLGKNNNGHWDDIWIDNIKGYETELLSHVCLNGSFSHLPLDEWNDRCFPNNRANLGWRRSAGVWSLFNFIVGVLGNILTLVAVMWAKKNCRYAYLFIYN